ncbi:uncharacterized protein AMSG_10681 [Thecamonas trahens ATCC 50062]|uniref:Sushi domain-containing protein n=1 Tax=Thecamonas trahens ATCC 50062 TaxID=461836 RepID=A0A0L0DRZ8_THETB|nr:hypothetical protein AMSG_10681 [Thecamonas trahens ATCC 50062]KNC55084.1 hypothetical protein AMSG_10681 [Thecamonas trahens ATCC 50062]|eukprot:XP_013753268.1 hypothetical protein AMSG_10681 [Thecamonas trahens ATCC 50062]
MRVRNMPILSSQLEFYVVGTSIIADKLELASDPADFILAFLNTSFYGGELLDSGYWLISYSISNADKYPLLSYTFPGTADEINNFALTDNLVANLSSSLQFALNSDKYNGFLGLYLSSDTSTSDYMLDLGSSDFEFTYYEVCGEYPPIVGGTMALSPFTGTTSAPLGDSLVITCEPGMILIAFSDYGYVGSVAVARCDPGLDAIAGTIERTCIGSSWSGSPVVCALVACPSLALPSFGSYLCSNGSSSSLPGSFNETCTFSCEAGRTLVGESELICRGNSEWSADEPFCSSFNVSRSIVSVAPSPPMELSTVESFTMSLDLRDSAGNPTGEGSDQPYARELASGALLVSSTSFDTATLRYTATVAAPTRVGDYIVELGVNSIAFPPANRVVLTVSPGPAAGVQSYVVNAPSDGTFALETGEARVVTVTVCDVYGNEVAVPPALSAVAIALQRGAESRLISDFVLSGSALTFEVVATEGGTYTLSIRIADVDIIGSPAIVQASTTCFPGTRVIDGVRCTACSGGSYSETVDAVTCTDCPGFSTSTPGSSSFLNCTCLRTFWFGSGSREPDKPCVPCPAGAVCLGGTEPPRAAPGFEPSDDGAAFVACPRPAACAGSGQCAAGYRGRLCAECAAGWYRLGDACHKCRGSNAVIIVALVLLVFAYVAGVVWINTRNTRVYGYAAFVIALNTLQAVAIYGTIQLEWHPVATAIFDVVSLVNLNLDLASPECGLDVGDVWMFKWGMTMALPVLFLLPFAVVTAVLCVLFNIREAKGLVFTINPRVMGAAGRGYLQTILLLYLPLMYAALRYVDCTNVGGGIVVMTTNPQRRCYTAAWYSLLPLILVVAFGYGLSIPAALVVFLTRKHAALDLGSFYAKYAFLTAKYKPAMYRYELAILGRKLFVVVAVCGFRSPTVKASLIALFYASLVLAACLLDHKPYAEAYHSRLDVVTLFGSFVLLWGGTISSSATLRDSVVITAIIGLLAVLGIGIGYEVWRIRARDAAEVDVIFADDGLVGEVEMDKMPSAHQLDNHSFSDGSISIGESNPDMRSIAITDSVTATSPLHSLGSGPIGSDLIPLPPALDGPVVTPDAEALHAFSSD